MNLELLNRLIRCKSITPDDDGAIQICTDFLKELGFSIRSLNSNSVKNLYAKLGNYEKNICFAGHIDVVPPFNGWSSAPFELNIRNEKAYGRGTNDMKGPLSSCLLAISEAVSQNTIPSNTSISVMLTSDEEKMGDHGTKSIVEYLNNINEKITLCVLCESCSPYGAGEYIKIGCRGSLNVNLRSIGPQCHVAQAPNVSNHLHNFIRILDTLCHSALDRGNKNFDPSSIQLTSIDSVLNVTRNIVPTFAEAFLNVRFNDNWNFEKLENYISLKTHPLNAKYERFGEAFIGCSTSVVQKLQKILGDNILVGTKGGNSDALFIKDITDVVEIGSPLSEAHIVDEYITIHNLKLLKNIYLNIIQKYTA